MSRRFTELCLAVQGIGRAAASSPANAAVGDDVTSCLFSFGQGKSRELETTGIDFVRNRNGRQPML